MNIERPPATAGNDEIVHFIDDEPDIVRIATSALQNAGYSVHSFTKPSEALEDMRINCKEKMSIVITDVRMPGYSGFEVARLVRTIKPDVPIVLITAFEINSNEFEKVFPSLEINQFLQKPFHIKQLLEVVENILDGA